MLERARQLLHARAEEVGHLGGWAWNADTGEILWSENLFRLLGLIPGEIEPTLRALLERTHPDDRERVEREIAQVQVTLEPSELSYRAVLPDGRVRHLEATTTLAGHMADGSPMLIGCVRDVTDQRWAEREIAAHVATADALSQWQSLKLGGERLLRELACAMNFERGLLWIPGDSVLVPRVAWRQRDGFEVLGEVRDIRLAPGVGVAGRAWSTRMPEAVRNVKEEGGYQFREYALREGLRGALAIPVVEHEDVLAVLCFASEEEITLSARLMVSIVGIGRQVATFLSRRRADLDGPRLTPRQIDVVRLAAQGRSVQQIAEGLRVSTATVKTHFEHIYERYGVSDRAAAVARALRDGVIQ